MFRFGKPLALLVALLFLGATCFEDAYAQRRSSGSSRPSSSRPSSSRPSSSSKPKYGSPSSSSKPSSRPPSSSSSSKPKYGSPGSSSPSSSSRPPQTSSGKPKYGSPGSSNTSSKPKYTSPNSNTRPPTNSSRKPSSSSRPSTSSGTSKEQANRQATSRRRYEETKKATAPPKPSYTTADGRTVKVRTNSSHVSTIRSKPSSYYTPAARETRITNHIHHHHYSHDYNWYYSQPSYYVGGGYSSAYWWMMMEWSAERRARWLYHNRDNIEAAAYQRGMQDAAVAAQIQQLEAQKLARNGDYVDPEFSDNPGMMYSQDYIEAAYNPTVISPGTGTALTVLLWLIIIGVVGYAIFLFMTKVRFGS